MYQEETDIFGLPAEETDPIAWVKAEVQRNLLRGIEPNFTVMTDRVARRVPSEWVVNFLRNGVGATVRSALRKEFDGTLTREGKTLYVKFEELDLLDDNIDVLAADIKRIRNDEAALRTKAHKIIELHPEFGLSVEEILVLADVRSGDIESGDE